MRTSWVEGLGVAQITRWETATAKIAGRPEAGVPGCVYGARAGHVLSTLGPDCCRWRMRTKPGLSTCEPGKANVCQDQFTSVFLSSTSSSCLRRQEVLHNHTWRGILAENAEITVAVIACCRLWALCFECFCMLHGLKIRRSRCDANKRVHSPSLHPIVNFKNSCLWRQAVLHNHITGRGILADC